MQQKGLYQRHPAWFVFALFASLLALPHTAMAAKEDPVAFLQSLQDHSIEQLGDASIPIEVREERFREIFNDSFDLPAIGQFVVGRYWKRADEQDKKDFLAVFEDAMVQRFLPIFSEKSDVRLTFGAAQGDEKRKGMYLVNSVLPRENGEAVNVAWRVRYRDSGPRILDIIIEGASMAITLRSEYSTFVKQNGGEVSKLTELLREKVENGAFAAKLD
jgi:phospholipid transport system substrate-binding protein